MQGLEEDMKPPPASPILKFKNGGGENCKPNTGNRRIERYGRVAPVG